MAFKKNLWKWKKLLFTISHKDFFAFKRSLIIYFICTCCQVFNFVINFNYTIFTTQSRLLTTPTKKPFENIVGKGENAGNQHFLLFPQCFLPFTRQISNFQSCLFCCLQMLSIWTGLKFCRLVKR